MANQTISVDSNHDDLTGRFAGENITVNAGAVLTVDSQPQETSSGILGDITVNEGEVHFDATAVFELTYDGGVGALPVIGDVVDNLTQTGTAKVTRIHAGATAVAGTLTVTVQTGAFADNDSLDFNTAAWTALVNGTLVVGYMRIFGEDQVWGIFGLSTFRCTGAEYVLGTGDGTDAQSFTLPHNGVQHCIWIETGNGTGIYTKWARIHGSANLSDFGIGLEGNVFSQALLSNTVTFGTDIAGGAPANGARMWIPNIHFATTSVGAPMVEIISSGSLNLEIQQNLSADLQIDHTNWSTAELTLLGMRSVAISTSCYPQKSTIGIGVCGSLVQIDDCCLCASPEYGVVNALIIADSPLGVTIQDTLFVHLSQASVDVLNVATTTDTTLRRCEMKQLNPTSTGVPRCIELISDVNTIIEDCSLLAVNGLALTSGCKGARVTNLTLAHIGTGAGDSILVLSGSNDAIIDGVVLAGRGPEDDFVVISDVADVTVKNIGAILAKVDIGAQANHAFNVSGFISNVKLQRIWTEGGDGSQFVATNNAGTGLAVLNCSSDYDREVDMDNNNCIIRGIHGGSGPLGSVTGPETDYSNVTGFNFYDLFGSDITGKLAVIANAPGTLHAPDVLILAGTPIYNGLGDVLMRGLGDQIEWTFPYSILGHTGFRNIAPQTAGTALLNLLIEYAVDTGGGFGVYQTANAANLSAETIAPTGFRLRIRVTTTTASSTTRFTAVAFLTDTTLADQAANFYDITEPHTVSVTGLTAGTDVVYIEDDTGAQQEFLVATAAAHAFSFSGLNAGEAWTLVVKRPGAEPVVVPFTVAEGGATVLAYVPRVLFRAGGAAMYTASSDALVTDIGFDLGAPQATVDIGDGLAPAQAVFDEFEVALVTAPGMAWLAQQGTTMAYDSLPAGEFIFLQDNIRLRRNLAGDVNAAVGAFVLSTQGTPIDGTNGSVGFVAGGSGGGVADWTAVEREQIRFRLALDGTQTDPTTGVGTLEEIFARAFAIDIRLPSDPADESVQLASHAVTQAAVAALPTPLTAAQVNTEADTALADYDGPTRAELTTDIDSVLTRGDVGPWTTGGGGGGMADWTVAEREQIRDALGVDGTKTTAVSGQLQAMQGAGFATGTDSLEALRDRGDAAWATAAGFETEATASTRAVADLAAHGVTQAAVAALPTPLTAAQVNAEVDTALVDYGGSTSAQLLAAVAPLALTTEVQAVITQGDFAWTTAAGFETETDAAARAVTNQAEHDATQATLAALPAPSTSAVITGLAYNPTTSRVEMEVYLVRDGARVTAPASSSVAVFAPGGTVAVVTGASASPNARGVFSFSLGPVALTSNVVYTVDVSVDDGAAESATYTLPVHA